MFITARVRERMDSLYYTWLMAVIGVALLLPVTFFTGQFSQTSAVAILWADLPDGAHVAGHRLVPDQPCPGSPADRRSRGHTDRAAAGGDHAGGAAYQ